MNGGKPKLFCCCLILSFPVSSRLILFKLFLPYPAHESLAPTPTADQL
jgi:hypothetical protein